MGIRTNDLYWIRYALKLAILSSNIKEIPIGALLVLDNSLIGKGWNKSISLSDPSGHAEIISIRQASLNTLNYRKTTSTIYITNEPCMMCIGAIIQARINRIVFTSKNFKNGINFNTFCLLEKKKDFENYTLSNYFLIKKESGMILKSFFEERRLKNKLLI